MMWNRMNSSNCARYAPELLTKSIELNFIKADFDLYNTEVPPRIVGVDTAAARRMRICSFSRIVGFVEFKICSCRALCWANIRENANTRGQPDDAGRREWSPAKRAVQSLLEDYGLTDAEVRSTRTKKKKLTRLSQSTLSKRSGLRPRTYRTRRDYCKNIPVLNRSEGQLGELQVAG